MRASSDGDDRRTEIWVDRPNATDDVRHAVVEQERVRRERGVRDERRTQ